MTSDNETEIVSEVIILPTGMKPDDPNLSTFALRVHWQGAYNGKSGGGYKVARGGSAELSRKGKWGYPERFQRWQYRWESLEDALDAAREAVNQVSVMGTTWADWRDRK